MRRAANERLSGQQIQMECAPGPTAHELGESGGVQLTAELVISPKKSQRSRPGNNHHPIIDSAKLAIMISDGFMMRQGQRIYLVLKAREN